MVDVITVCISEGLNLALFAFFAVYGASSALGLINKI